MGSGLEGIFSGNRFNLTSLYETIFTNSTCDLPLPSSKALAITALGVVGVASLRTKKAQSLFRSIVIKKIIEIFFKTIALQMGIQMQCDYLRYETLPLDKQEQKTSLHFKYPNLKKRSNPEEITKRAQELVNSRFYVTSTQDFLTGMENTSIKHTYSWFTRTVFRLAGSSANIERTLKYHYFLEVIALQIELLRYIKANKWENTKLLPPSVLKQLLLGRMNPKEIRGQGTLEQELGNLGFDSAVTKGDAEWIEKQLNGFVT